MVNAGLIVFLNCGIRLLETKYMNVRLLLSYLRSMKCKATNYLKSSKVLDGKLFFDFLHWRRFNRPAYPHKQSL